VVRDKVNALDKADGLVHARETAHVECLGSIANGERRRRCEGRRIKVKLPRQPWVRDVMVQDLRYSGNDVRELNVAEDRIGVGSVHYERNARAITEYPIDLPAPHNSRYDLVRAIGQRFTRPKGQVIVECDIEYMRGNRSQSALDITMVLIAGADAQETARRSCLSGPGTLSGRSVG
jgi:hypothetical protein